MFGLRFESFTWGVCRDLIFDMLLIADSGSTKTDWRLVDEEGQTIARTKTEGLNPYFLSVEKISDILKEHVLPIVSDVDKIFFYGAGCGSALKAEQVKDALSVIETRLPSEVCGDMLGSARSLLQDNDGIACILGTGSNSCRYDGREIVDIMPSLGFMFSDWGSGTVMCKDLVALLLQEKLPRELVDDFHATYNMGRVEILDHIYNKPMPNRFLASFTPFLLKYSEEPSCRNIILANFRNFFSYYVLRYPKTMRPLKVSFTGSIAKKFQKYLLEVSEAMDIEIEEIVQHPMEGLIRYHCITVPVSINGR
jgi:N-acetylglucosamine kinase-like BadF-type ATPase